MTTQPQGDDTEITPQAEEAGRLLALVRAAEDDELEAAWMAAAEDEAMTIDHLLPILQEVVSRGDAKLLESLVWLLLSIRGEHEGAEVALEAAWQVRDLLPDSGSLRDEIAGLYRQVHAETAGIETLTEMTVRRRDVPLKVALGRMEKFLGLPPGTYVSDSRRKSPGRVIGVDAGRKVLAVSFGESDRAYDATSVENLEVLEADDFRAMAIFDRPQLAAIAEDDPVRLVRLVLTAYGPRLGMKDLKGRLVDVAVPADGWSKWWSSSRTKVKRSPLIEMSEGVQPDFFLRQRPVVFEDTARERYEAARSVYDKLLVMVEYLKEAGHDPASESDLLTSFASDLAGLAEAASGAAAADVLAALAMLAEIRTHLGAAAPPMPAVPAGLLADRAGLAAAMASVRSDDLAGRVLTLVHESLPEAWPDVYAAALPGCSQEMCERMAAELIEAGRADLVAAAAAAVMRQPDQSVSALCWLWKNAGQGRYPEVIGDLNRASMTIRLLQAVNEVALVPTDDKPRQQDLLWQVRRTISARDFGILRDILDSTDSGWAREIRAAASRNSGLTDHLRIQVLEVLGKAHPVPIARTVPPWEEDVVYTTEAALEAKRKEFDHLLHVKLPQNSTAIGEAAARGDLSENAEFTAALEERDHLTERANAMQTDLAKAKPIPRTLAVSATANIGTTVRARRASTGTEETLTFLGLWDAKPERGIYYYKAPLALAFMGKAVGETVTLKADEEQSWEILEITPAI